MEQKKRTQFYSGKRVVALLMTLLLVLGLALCGCEKQDTKPHKTTAAQTEAAKPQKGLAVLTYVDTDLKKLSFQWVESGESAMFPYNGATWFYSKSKNSISAAQLSAGEVVQITYDANSNLISEVRVATDDNLMENTRVSNFFIDDTAHTMRVGSTLYQYDDSTLVFSDGKNIDIQELNHYMDTLHVWAYGTHIISVVVENGHGYLSLSGESLFIGGLITIGTVLVRNIEDDMMLTVSEGTYKVTVENGGYFAEKEVTIERGKQQNLDLSDVLANVTENGNVRFTITPSDAELYIDGVKTEYATIVTMTAGAHNITVLSTDYEAYSDTVTISADYQEINIDLTKPTEETSAEATETTADATASTSTAESTENASTSMEQNTTAEGGVVSEKNKVTVSGPAGASVYFDSTLMGSAPVTFALVTGAHIITILEGTRIRSYSVNLAEGGDDVVYDFSE